MNNWKFLKFIIWIIYYRYQYTYSFQCLFVLQEQKEAVHGVVVLEICQAAVEILGLVDAVFDEIEVSDH